MTFSHDAEMPFAKMTGSGNDFVVIDNREPLLPNDAIPDFVRAVCRRGVAIGADGVVLIEACDRDDVDFHWRYINADGSDGEMCGNGAMCGARFAVLKGIALSPTRFLTPDGIVTAEIDDPSTPQVRIAISDPGDIRCVSIDVDGRALEVFALRMGVPHAITITDDADAFADAATFHRIGRAIRMHDAFSPAGTNFNVIHRIDARTIRMRTYERGVEAETLACGTGAVASAVVAVRQGIVEPPVTVITSSGRPLDVRWTERDGRVADVWLGGEARVVATGTLHPEGWTA
ncbi:MAG TPA: diaminopimelate epimerase [Thermomicrobiales bacterium]|nr:diaminopimelate epimerase [Thermomicrobiales bacterium]